MSANVLKLAVDLLRALLPTPPLAIRVEGPDIDENELTLVSNGLRRVVGQVIQELGIEREIDVVIDRRVDDSEVVEVSADGRPIAIFPSPTTDWSAQVVARTHRGLLRRARVLLDDATVEKAGKRLPGTIADGSQGAVRRTVEYLMDNGIGTRTLEFESVWDGSPSPSEAAEWLINELATRKLNVFVAESALRNTANDERTWLINLRQALYNECGIWLPDLAIAAHDPEPGEVRVKLNDLLSPFLVVNEQATLPFILTVLRPILVEHAAWLLRADDVESQRAELGLVIPELDRLSKGHVPTWLLCACLRSLMANSDSVRNLPRILWLLLESGPQSDGIDEVILARPVVDSLPMQLSDSHDPEFLASTVRRLIAYEAWVGGETPTAIPLVSLPIDCEQTLLRASDASSTGKAECRIVRTIFRNDPTAVVVAHTVAGIGPLRQALRALPEPPQVIASQELPPDAPLPRVLKG
ncbi:hypothetical protein [Alloactinosynnema sp. L-07]|uniref:hypothetical protein n=1 Tax=Alloactinosynnema sp. L-07 TaxID=1653480 RepID=UPI00065EEFD6|nr:hypothetical protein [Alloactinosynnema sp. L-07]CRK59245.1 hypothetical protein [Alloactinosynnema sp. L-07]